MKARTLNKWIPKDTIYCYRNGKYHGMSGDCRFYTDNKNIEEEDKHDFYNSGYCKLMNTEIFDRCKVCGINRAGWFTLNEYTKHERISFYFYKDLRVWKKKQERASTNS